jgi:hypothetical protein
MQKRAKAPDRTPAARLFRSGHEKLSPPPLPGGFGKLLIQV